MNQGSVCPTEWNEHSYWARGPTVGFLRQEQENTTVSKSRVCCFPGSVGPFALSKDPSKQDSHFSGTVGQLDLRIFDPKCSLHGSTFECHLT